MIDRARELLSHHNVLPGSGVSDQDIRSAEDVVGQFPDDYRYFLREYGWVSVGHLEIYGLGSAIPGYLDVVRMTLLERAESGSPIPDSYVCVMNDGSGNLFCFDVDRSRERAGSPIILWDHELGPDQRPEIKARSFEVWLANLLESEL